MFSFIYHFYHILRLYIFLQLGRDSVTYRNEIIFSSVRNPENLSSRNRYASLTIWVFTLQLLKCVTCIPGSCCSAHILWLDYMPSSRHTSLSLKQSALVVSCVLTASLKVGGLTIKQLVGVTENVKLNSVTLGPAVEPTSASPGHTARSVTIRPRYQPSAKYIKVSSFLKNLSNKGLHYF